MSAEKKPIQKPKLAEIAAILDGKRIPFMDGTLYPNADGGTVFVGFPMGQPLKSRSIPFPDWESDWNKPANRPDNSIEDSFTDYLRGVIAIERYSPPPPAARKIESPLGHIGMSAQTFRNKRKAIKPFLRPDLSLLVGKTDEGRIFAAVVLGKKTEESCDKAFAMTEGDREAHYVPDLSISGAKLIKLI